MSVARYVLFDMCCSICVVPYVLLDMCCSICVAPYALRVIISVTQYMLLDYALCSTHVHVAHTHVHIYTLLDVL